MKLEVKDPKASVLDELMKYLDTKDDESLGEAVKPKGVGIEAVKVKKIGADGLESPEDEAMESPEHEAAESPKEELSEHMGSKMSDQEMDDLIEAIKSKLG